MELISGPDLGGGFLFQLTVEPRDGGERYTVHAQEGGLEAAAPAKGSPTEFGFEAHRGVCPVGGRECYHREYDVGEGERSRVRMTYNRTRFVLGPMFEQRFGSQPVNLEAGLAEVVDRVGPAMKTAASPWFVGGSTSAWLQGVEGAPRDLDLGTDEPGVAILAEALGEYLIEPAARTTWPPDRTLVAARAYVGTLQAGVRVEWAAPPTGAPGPGTADEWGWPARQVRTVSVEWNGRTVPVARLEYALVQAVARRDGARTTRIADRLRQLGTDPALLGELLGRSDARTAAAVVAALELRPPASTRPTAGS